MQALQPGSAPAEGSRLQLGVDGSEHRVALRRGEAIEHGLDLPQRRGACASRGVTVRCLEELAGVRTADAALGVLPPRRSARRPTQPHRDGEAALGVGFAVAWWGSGPGCRGRLWNTPGSEQLAQVRTAVRDVASAHHVGQRLQDELRAVALHDRGTVMEPECFECADRIAGSGVRA